MMILEMNSTKAGLEEAVKHKANQLLRFSLSRFEGVITRVKVHFSDTNGPKGGVDKRCRISAKLRTDGQLVASGEGCDHIEALSYCVDKLSRSVRREIEKRRGFPFYNKRNILDAVTDKNESTMVKR